MGENYPYRTGARLLMIPAALVIGVIVGLIWAWDAGLLIGTLLIWLAPELLVIFSKRWRILKAQEEETQRQHQRELFDELEKKYPNESSDPIEEPEYIDRIDKEIFGI